VFVVDALEMVDVHQREHHHLLAGGRLRFRP
jgi:hypothetical protein